MNVDQVKLEDHPDGAVPAAPLDPIGPTRVIELAARCSLTPKTARIFVASVAAPTFALAGLLTLQGFWPILAYAVAEMALLIWALRASLRAGRRRETITISEQSVTIRRYGVGPENASVFPRHWTRVTLHAPLVALHPSRLTLESHGRACEVGQFLTEDERRNLAVRLKHLVGNVNESPAL
jgi:uncharacterized membrane protein